MISNSSQTPNRRRAPDASGKPSARRHPDAGGATPPLLIGGVIQHYPNRKRVFDPAGSGVDFCTVTVSEDAGRVLLAKTLPSEPGGARTGFKVSEHRVCMGGFVWRRWEPIQPSKDFGERYESWECESQASRWLDAEALALEARPTRLDYAYDFACDIDLFPRDVLSVFRHHLVKTRMEPHFAGPESSCTVYVGSRTSDRRVKIYRRDLKDEALLLDGYPPMVRVEVELRGDAVRALWSHRKATGDDGKAIAATHVADLIGYAVQDHLDPLPPLPAEATDEADVAQMLLQFIEQNASMLDAVRLLGVDLSPFVRSRVAGFSRMTEWRHRERMAKFAGADPEAVRRFLVDRLLAGSTPSGLPPVL